MIHAAIERFVRGRGLPRTLSLLLLCSLVATCALFPAGRAYGATAELSVGHRIAYGGYHTNAFSVNGMEAYCGDPNSKTPAPGSYEMRPLDDPLVAAGLWYGFGGPGFRPSLWPATDSHGDAMDDDDHRVATHVSLAFLATNDADFAYGSCDEEFKRWCDEQLFAENAPCGRIRTAGFTLDGASVLAEELPRGFTAYAMATGADSQTMYAMDHRPQGIFEMHKSSRRPDLSDHNASYSLAGARYGVYADDACTAPIATLLTDADGDAVSPPLDPGTYWVKEMEPPPGFTLDPTVHKIAVGAQRTGTLTVQDEPLWASAALLLRKVDDETDGPTSPGAATLAGAEYTVRFFAGRFDDVTAAEGSDALRRTWRMRTDDRGELHLSDAAKVAGDELYRDEEGRPVLPLGTLVIQEATPPKGYLLSDQTFVLAITPSTEGPWAIVDAAPLHRERAVRGDLSFVKVRETDQQRLANVPFRLASNTTGEAHILLTDANGEVRTQAAWNLHTQRTNANDAAVDGNDVADETRLDAAAGVWFGEGEPRDDRGALPFDTYSLTELPVEANAGLQLIHIPALVIERDSVVVNGGTLDDRPEPTPTLRTTARDGLDGDKTVAPTAKAVIIDHVRCSELAIGADYRVTGHLMDRASGNAVVDGSGRPVTSQTAFRADEDHVTVELAFPFDASAYGDSDIVVFETLEDGRSGEAVVVESNLDEHEQTVRVLPRISSPSDPQPPFPSKPSQPSPVGMDAPETIRASLAATGDQEGTVLIVTVAALGALSALIALSLAHKRGTTRRRSYRERLRRNDL